MLIEFGAGTRIIPNWDRSAATCRGVRPSISVEVEKRITIVIRLYNNADQFVVAIPRGDVEDSIVVLSLR